MLDHNLVLKSDELYLVGNISTDGSRERATGLYARDTRHLSRFLITLNGQRPERLQVRAVDPSHATVISGNPLLTGPGGTVLPQRVLIEQHVSASDALTATIAIQNFDQQPIQIDLGIELAADFRDLFDIRGFPRASRGTWRRPRISERVVTLSYAGLDGQVARTRIEFDKSPVFTTRMIDDGTAEPHPQLPEIEHVTWEIESIQLPEVLATFSLALVAGERWETTLRVIPEPVDGPLGAAPDTLNDRVSQIKTDSWQLNRVLERSLSDLDVLQTRFPHGAVPAAGIPWYVAPFGRDSLIVGLQTLHLMPQRAADTLRVLGALQGKVVNPAREEEPGKILHEMRYGEMARLQEIPHTPYYGTVDATPLYAWLFAETVAWTGDRALYDELVPYAQRALEWCETFGDPDRDGLVEYRNDNGGGARIGNQVWKDSFDSLNHTDGRHVIGPVAAVEVQGYLYAAYCRIADVAQAFGDPEWASELRAKGITLQAKVEEQFWMEDEGFYAQALDGEKQQVRALTSNPGHLTMTGLSSPERAARMAQRMSEPDFSSGWGVRTLVTGAVTYNPMSYHNGSVWPHDNSMIGAGVYRYRLTEAGGEIARSLLDAALQDPLYRLPELYCGFSRAFLADESPVAYPVSCSPQAWAAGSFPLLLRAMLGLEPDIATRSLRVRPALPDWVSTVTLDHLRVFGETGSLTVRRDSGGFVVESTGLPIAHA